MSLLSLYPSLSSHTLNSVPCFSLHLLVPFATLLYSDMSQTDASAFMALIIDKLNEMCVTAAVATAVSVYPHANRTLVGLLLTHLR